MRQAINEAMAYADYLTQLVSEDSDNDNQKYGSGGVVRESRAGRWSRWGM